MMCMHCLEEGEWADEDKCPKCAADGHASPWRVGACPACNKSFFDKMDELNSTIRKRVKMEEPILQFFTYEHLPPHLRSISKPFCDLAHAIVLGDNCPESGNVSIGPPFPRNAERSVALRKLLEAKDAAVRAMIAK